MSSLRGATELELGNRQPRFRLGSSLEPRGGTKMTKAGAEDSAVMTGRDGGVDYAAKMDLVNPGSVAHIEAHVYRVIEVVGPRQRASTMR
jgi:hypothetical protein